MQIREHVGAANPALVMHPSGITVSFATLEWRANQLAHHFRRAGLGHGDTVAVVMENTATLHVVMWAARRSGLYYVLVNTQLTAAEAAYIFDDCNPRAIVASARMQELTVSAVALMHNRPPDLRVTLGATVAGWARYPDCCADLPGSPIADEGEGDLLQYSSGTTGRPKGIRRDLPGAAPADAPVQLAPMLELLGVSAESVYLSPAPLYHTAPAYWTMSVQAVGGTVVVMEKFTAQGALEAIEKHRVTHGQFVPAMFVRMLKLPERRRSSYDTSSLQRIVHAAAPCPPDIKRQMMSWWGPIVDEYYSSSEGVGSTFIRAEEWLAHPGSVGRPMMGIPHVLDDAGNELPPGTAGTLYFEDGMDFAYLGDAQKTADTQDVHGWRTVGDIGYLDDAGYLYLTDRRHHMIISGGVNIYPREAEDVLISHPLVLDAAVFGLPEAEMGQAVTAAVQLVDAAEHVDAVVVELLAWTRARLAHYKCPRVIFVVDALPRSDSGKMLKHKLIDQFASAPTHP